MGSTALVEKNGEQVMSAAAAFLTRPEGKMIAASRTDRLAAPKTVPAIEGNKQIERFLAGGCGDELLDYEFRFDTSGQARQTVVYFYGDDLRAGQTHRGLAVCRKAVYHGQVDPARLHAARKLSDILYIGPAGHERRDYRLDYHANGIVARTVVYLYEDDTRAAEAPSGAARRRQIVYAGKLAQPELGCLAPHLLQSRK